MAQQLLSVDQLTNQQVLNLFDVANSCLQQMDSPSKRSHPLAGYVLATAFYENSTRTRLSFNLAAQYLGMHVVDLNVATASVQKGETLADTLGTLAAMGVNVVALRHGDEAIHETEALPVCNDYDIGMLNAGAGKRAHPTQALLDLFTLWGQWQGELNGKIVTMVGDIAHSRVAASNAKLLQRFGVEVCCVAPDIWQPDEVNPAFEQVSRFSNMADGLADVDAVMALRIQHERHGNDNAVNCFDVGDYQVNHQTIKWAKPDVVVLHPGPMNRGVEITSELADDDRFSLIHQQVRHGVAIRMALIAWALDKIV